MWLYPIPAVAQCPATWNDFYERAEKVDSKMMLSKAELRIQYRDYCRRLDSLEGEYTSLQIFTTLLHPKNKLHQH